MRAYTVAATAVALAMPRKWVDNTLSHFDVPGVRQSRQGVSRKLSPRAVLILAIGLRLVRALGVPMHIALQLAARLAKPGGAEPRIEVAGGVWLEMDVAPVATDIEARLAQAVELTPIPRRGRPPGRNLK